MAHTTGVVASTVMDANPPRLEVLRGIQASGKSTYARQRVADGEGRVFRLNRDDLRDMAHNGQYIHEITEPQIQMAETVACRALLASGQADVVIIDDTNLSFDHLRLWDDIAFETGAVIEIVDFHVDIDEAIRRDSLRLTPVGEHVIRRSDERLTHARAAKWRPRSRKNAADPPLRIEPVEHYVGLPGALVVDIDNTLALHTPDRVSPYEVDDESIASDLPNVAVIDVIRRYYDTHDILFTSGRSDRGRDATIRWIMEHVSFLDPHDFHLFMRPHGDPRKDAQLKLDIFNDEIRGQWTVDLVLDDRDQVVALWRALGLPCFQVGPGGF